ncbi:hypothetical protein A0006_13600 [Listeria monocytogenes]|nr:hypothetical protein [Listeria monocytogenes]EAF8941957.1 hypothetical protein [Listeria monocytogenes]EAF8947963.1 hypothetical protein [Listeria monocytogenes]EAF8950567.1 hypothetical protein [Listeria monocytogenes]EAF8953674.1 hypothetical protein [Listeria monocytogenes]
MDKQINDMDVLDFGRSISMISIDTPISIEFDKNFGQKENRWWTCQREHLTIWCLYQPTPGISEFKHKPNNSASVMYNNFGRPETLLWLSEALGENKEVLLEIVNEIKDIKNCRSACAKLRKKISFDRILELMEGINRSPII